MSQTDINFGLSEDEVAARLAPKSLKLNSFYSNQIKTFWLCLSHQISSIFFLLLLAAAGISFIIGQITDAWVLTVIALINSVLGFIQEYRANIAGSALRSLVIGHCLVKRQGQLISLPTTDLVLGDIIHLPAGSILSVDILVRATNKAEIDESMVTGESQTKIVNLGERINSGTSVVRGTLVGEIIAVGDNTSLGQYADHLDHIKKDQSFNRFVSNIGRDILAGSITVLTIVLVISVFFLKLYSFSEFLIFSIALLVGVIPEALPLIVTLIMTSEALALSKKQVIVKRLNSLQELGAIKFLLTDKTGTLTENKPTVVEVYDNNCLWTCLNLIQAADYDRSPMDNIFDQAIRDYQVTNNFNLGEKINLKNFEPYDPAIGYTQFETETGQKIIRGQWSKISDLVSDDIPLAARLRAQELEAHGHRILSLATLNSFSNEVASNQEAKNYHWCGFVAMADPLKPGVHAVLAEAKKYGVKIKILTGDTVEVSDYIAKQLKLPQHKTISLEQVSVDNCTKDLSATVFAKCKPEHKLALINALSEIGPVAFVGEGINDALALKQADVGLVVSNGSDIAREAGDILLLEKGLEPIMMGIKLSRKAFNNVLTYITYTLTGNAGTFFSLLFLSLISGGLPMLPSQILLNNLLTDLPLILLITDNVEPGTIHRAPKYQARALLRKVLIFGLISTAFDFLFFFLTRNQDLALRQTGWFLLSVLSELILVLSIRSPLIWYRAIKPSNSLLWAIHASALMAFIFIYNSTLASWFRLTPLPINIVIIILILVLAYGVCNEIAKAWLRYEKNK